MPSAYGMFFGYRYRQAVGITERVIVLQKTGKISMQRAQYALISGAMYPKLQTIRGGEH